MLWGCKVTAPTTTKLAEGAASCAYDPVDPDAPFLSPEEIEAAARRSESAANARRQTNNPAAAIGYDLEARVARGLKDNQIPVQVAGKTFFIRYSQGGTRERVPYSRNEKSKPELCSISLRETSNFRQS